MRRILIVLFVFTVFDFYGQIQSYSLESVVAMAQEKSPDALVAKYQLIRNYWAYRTYKRGLLPQLYFTGTLPSINRAFSNYTNSDGSQSYIGQKYVSYSGELKVKKRIGLTGGNIFLSSGLQRVDNFKDTTTTHNFLSTPINIGISQPLFNYNPYKWKKKIEPIKYTKAKRVYIETVEKVAITAVNYYFTLLKAQMNLKIQELNVQNYDTLYKLAEGRYQMGKTEENDLLQLELKYLQSKSALEMAKLNYDNALFRFKSFLRLPANETVLLIDPRPAGFVIVDRNEALDAAQKNSSEILNFETQMLQANANLDRAKKENGFNADLYAVFGLTQNAILLPDAYKDPRDQQTVRLGVSIPIYDWGQRKGQVMMAESNLEIVKSNVEQRQIDFRQRVFLEVTKFNMQQSQLYVAAKSDTIAMRAYDITKNRYYIGKITVTDLNISQNATDRARINYLNALQTYWQSYYQLRKTTLYDFYERKEIEVDFDKLLK